jgi:hypothetical protein
MPVACGARFGKNATMYEEIARIDSGLGADPPVRPSQEVKIN